MSIIDHILLFTLLFAIFFAITRIPQKQINAHYWCILLIPIVCYSLILGCRYGWGNDYLWYKYRIEYPFRYDDEDWGFGSINLLLKNIGFNYVCVYILYSLVFILGAFTFIRDYANNKYLLAFFLPATLLLST